MGFVTGGSWITSLPGAYKPDPSLSGNANFGFVSKYQKGAKVPTGQTEFQFQDGRLNFHSSSYEWLVVSQNGTNAQYKGVGTINGAGSYNFMLWATDGASDTFRIKIWQGEDDVIYDNGFDQPIGGGSIVIHTGKKRSLSLNTKRGVSHKGWRPSAFDQLTTLQQCADFRTLPEFGSPGPLCNGGACLLSATSHLGQCCVQ